MDDAPEWLKQYCEQLHREMEDDARNWRERIRAVLKEANDFYNGDAKRKLH